MVIKFGYKVKFKWFGEFEELKFFVNIDLKILGIWSYIINNGGFYILKVEGILISFYFGMKIFNV